LIPDPDDEYDGWDDISSTDERKIEVYRPKNRIAKEKRLIRSFIK
jgi:hypothetical protein